MVGEKEDRVFEIGVRFITVGGKPTFLAILNGAVLSSFDEPHKALAFAQEIGREHLQLQIFVLRHQAFNPDIPVGYAVTVSAEAALDERFSYMDAADTVSAQRFPSEKIAAQAARANFGNVP